MLIKTWPKKLYVQNKEGGWKGFFNNLKKSAIFSGGWLPLHWKALIGQIKGCRNNWNVVRKWLGWIQGHTYRGIYTGAYMQMLTLYTFCQPTNGSLSPSWYACTDVMIGGMEAALKRPSSCEPVLLPVFHLRKLAGREYEDEQLWPFCILVKPTYPSEDRGDGASLETCENRIRTFYFQRTNSSRF